MAEILRSAIEFKNENTTPDPLVNHIDSYQSTVMSHHIIENREHSVSVPRFYPHGTPAAQTPSTDSNYGETAYRDKPAPKEENLYNGENRYTAAAGIPIGDIRSSVGLSAAPGVDEDAIMQIGDEPMGQVVDSAEGSHLDPSESGLGVLGGGMRGMVDLVNRLRASGIEDLGLPLPRIAVVGNQSAGKSSLIEAISGIKVPRYTGTCTRCPLEINLSESISPGDSWHCRISLRFKKRYDPMAAKQSVNSNGRPSSSKSPWVDQATEQVAFLDITDKNQVERVLVAAQQAVLNPSRNWREYVYELRPEIAANQLGVTGERSIRAGKKLPRGGGAWAGFEKGKRHVVEKKNIEEDFEVKFSPNVVCMEITGPDLPNLAFIDLPGVIQTTESESEHYLIDLVTGLVKDYVQEEDCLIMLALTMKDDAVNQSAARLAREFGEERTIGALTKPDTVGPGEYEQWVNILRGNSHRLRHGYFVTKQPNQEQLNQGIDHAQARAQEADFFTNSEPWATDLKDLKHRFGTQALQSYLAKELGELIKKRLPGVVESIKNQHAEVKEELAALPPPPTDNQVYLVHNLVREFDTYLVGHLSGGPGHNEFQQDLRRLADQFQRTLKSYRPTLKVFETLKEEGDFARLLETPRKAPASARRRGEGEWFGDRERESSPSLRKSRKHQVGVEVHTLSSDEENVASPYGKKRRVTNEGATVTPKKPRRVNPLSGVGDDAHKFNLPQIRHIIESTATARIPGQVDPKAITNLIKKTIRLWNPILADFLNSCGSLLNDRVHKCFTQVFKEYQKSPIFEAVYKVLNQLVTESFQRQKEAVERLWFLEEDQICTLNEEDYQRYIENHLEILMNRRARNLEEQKGQAAAAESAANADDNTMSSRKRKAVQNPPVRDTPLVDPYRKEVHVLAQVRAYNEVAQKRFVDNVYMSIQHEIVGVFSKGILNTLHTGLGLDKPEVAEICTDLLVEDPQKEKRRKELIGKSEQLSRAMEELCRITE